MAEQRYEAVRAVIADGETMTDVVAWFGVARKTVPDPLRQGAQLPVREAPVTAALSHVAVGADFPRIGP